MAVKTIEGGDRAVQIRDVAAENIYSLVSDGSHDATDYPEPDSTLSRFRRDMNAIFTQFALDEGTAGVQAQGTLTMDTNPLADDTCTIGSAVYTFVASADIASNTKTAVEVTIGTLVADTQANLTAAVNGTGLNFWFNPDVLMGAWASDETEITARASGTAGNSIATTETFDEDTNVFDAATLGTERAGVTEVPEATIAALAELGEGDSWSKCRTVLNTNFTAVDGVINAE